MPAFTWTLNLRITGRLILGFAALAAILAGAVGPYMVSGVSQNVDRMVNLRTHPPVTHYIKWGVVMS
jgi:hypothetical protein